jgi:hypothetical protein
MKQIINEPVLPLKITNTQYLPNGYGRPSATLYFLTDANGYTFHKSDNKWRKKSLIEITTHSFFSENAAQFYANQFDEKIPLENIDPDSY